VFPLSSVVTVIPGLPNKVHPMIAAGKFVYPNLGPALILKRKQAIVLRFPDGSLLPFDVRACANGVPFMTELVERLADRIDGDYEYTRSEVRALRSADLNRVVKPRGN
jgi:hypothetical protein